MNTSVNALVVPARLVHPVHIKTVELDLAALQRVAAGEVGRIASTDWHAYLDSEGIRYTENLRAEVLIREAGVDLDETIHGTAMFLGHTNPGEETDAPRHLIRLAEQLFDLPLAA
ncbi:hypothetical protein [Arthrobacter sp. Alg241-R88]|jgi:hypothetical protein|uniref:DUF3846 domain-containing protein n=1 Tax=Arthrobacter sp. Alg241-R88 TaxID=2305984 RepID=UPI0013D4EE36|nr:hypothetical protein [Arthrobacter sp. Alg241-R88]